ncbi:hypothetical protein Q7P35_007974 [Cladosporium inversicolor]
MRAAAGVTGTRDMGRQARQTAQWLLGQQHACDTLAPRKQAGSWNYSIKVGGEAPAPQLPRASLYTTGGIAGPSPLLFSHLHCNIPVPRARAGLAGCLALPTAGYGRLAPPLCIEQDIGPVRGVAFAAALTPVSARRLQPTSSLLLWFAVEERERRRRCERGLRGQAYKGDACNAGAHESWAAASSCSCSAAAGAAAHARWPGQSTESRFRSLTPRAAARAEPHFRPTHSKTPLPFPLDPSSQGATQTIAACPRPPLCLPAYCCRQLAQCAAIPLRTPTQDPTPLRPVLPSPRLPPDDAAVDTLVRASPRLLRHAQSVLKSRRILAPGTTRARHLATNHLRTPRLPFRVKGHHPSIPEHT